MVTFAFAESIQLIPDGTIVIHIIIIVTMVFVLNAILYKPISQVLSNRETSTRGQLNEARHIIQRVDDSLMRYESALRQARVDGYNILEREQSEESEERQQKIAIVRKEVEEQVKNQKNALITQAEEARTNLVEEARRVAQGISSKIIGH